MPHSTRRSLGATLLGIVLVMSAACHDKARVAGGDAETDSGDAETDSVVAETDSSVVETDGDVVEADGSTTVTSENESPSERTNDTLETAQAITIGDTLDGIIGAPVGDPAALSDDVDVFSFDANGGDILRLTLSAHADYVPTALIKNRDGTYARLLVGDGGQPPAGTRQFFIAATGEYFIQVVDARNVADPSENVGGPDVQYRFTLARETVTPIAVTLPATQSGAISLDEGVQLFSFTATANGGISAETRAARLEPASDVDTLLYLVDRSGAAPAVLAFNDDIDVNGGVYDSRMRALTPNAGAHVVVLDHYSVTGPNRAFSLDIAAFDPGVEEEGNDNLDQANPIPAPTVAAPTQVSGAIFKPAGGSEIDGDVFQFQATAGSYYEIDVTKPAGSNAAFVPSCFFVDPGGNVTFANPNTAGRSVARLEGYAFATGTHYLAVRDATSVGGVDYTYQVHIGVVPRVVTELGDVPVSDAAQTKLDQGGQTRWFSFAVREGAAYTLDLDLGGGASGNGIALNPHLTLFAPDGVRVVAGGALYLPDLGLEAGTYTLAVSDADGDYDISAGVNGSHAFRPRVVVTGRYALLTDDGSHTTRETAQAVGGDRARVSANLVAAGENWYALGTLEAGTGVTLITSAAAAGASVDTKITLVDAAGVGVPNGSNDDHGLFELFAQLVAFPVPATGDYFVRVEGGTPEAAGPYELFVQRDLCGGDAPTKLFINEVYPSPGIAASGDANGDGATNSSDEFIELVNPGRDDASLGGLIVRDLSGVRVRLSCGTVVAGGRALTLFGQCAEGTCGPGLGQSNATPVDPSGADGGGPDLGLDDAGDAVFLLSQSGVILDRLTYGAAPAGTSWARGSGGVCDAAPELGTGTTQIHSACTGAAGRTFSAGKKADDSDFTALAPLTNDTCATATTLTSGVALPAQDTSTFVDDYDASVGATQACDPGVLTFPGTDAAYTIEIPAGKLLTVIVRPTSPWDPGVSIVTDCAHAGPTCLALVDVGNDNATETATYRNAGAAALRVDIIVDSYAPSSAGEFEITATLSD